MTKLSVLFHFFSFLAGAYLAADVVLFIRGSFIDGYGAFMIELIFTPIIFAVVWGIGVVVRWFKRLPDTNPCDDKTNTSRL